MEDKLGSSSKLILYIVSLKMGNGCPDITAFKKRVHKVLGHKPDKVVLSGKWFEATFPMYAGAMNSLKKEGFKITPVKGGQ